MDPDKTAAILKMPALQTVKQIQSLLQSCSLYGRIIPNFSDISRRLSNLSKKNNSWNWEKEEKTVLKTCKLLLTGSSVLKRNDATKPHTSYKQMPMVMPLVRYSSTHKWKMFNEISKSFADFRWEKMFHNRIWSTCNSLGFKQILWTHRRTWGNCCFKSTLKCLTHWKSHQANWIDVQILSYILKIEFQVK